MSNEEEQNCNYKNSSEVDYDEPQFAWNSVTASSVSRMVNRSMYFRILLLVVNKSPFHVSNKSREGGRVPRVRENGRREQRDVALSQIVQRGRR